jgi:predicted dehydrogenase
LTESERTRVAIIGAGNIAGAYARDLATYPEVELVGVADIDQGKAEELAAGSGIRAYPSVEALIEDDSLDIVVNLTIHTAHKTVVSAALEAGRHVYSEKPLALSYPDARELVELAEEKGLRLGCSPCTWMGEAQQTAWKFIRDGKLGEVRVVFAEMNWGRIESWHPNPSAFYQVGPLWDIGVYPVTLLTTIYGPVRRVLAGGRVLYRDRVSKAGVPFEVTTPDFITGVVELESGPLVRLTVDFYVSMATKQKGIEFHGDEGSLWLGSPQDFHTGVEYAPFNEEYSPVEPVREPHQGPEWGRGVREMAGAIREERPHRATGKQAAHVVEVLDAISASLTTGGAVEVESGFTPPDPMDWAR